MLIYSRANDAMAVSKWYMRRTRPLRGLIPHPHIVIAISLCAMSP